MTQQVGRPGVQAVLFDLDGTLIDSAPDLAGTANDMRAARALAPLPHAILRLHGGSGARGLLGAAFAVAPDQPGYEHLRDEFLNLYARRLLRLTQPFPAAMQLLDALDSHGMPWGIVTNKALRFAQPLCEAFGLLARTHALVAGDSTAHTKPHPAPLLEAARRIGVPAAACIYVGDDIRDMQAGRAAGMSTLAASWGYLGDGAPAEQWGADHVLVDPAALLHWLDLA